MANHIVKYKELPLTGSEGELGPTSESPVYYYFLAALLFLGNNDIIFLGFINVLLQMLTIIIIYFLSKSMLDRQTAFITAILFGFSQGIVSQSSFIWTPYIMQPFINLSYLLLFLSYKMKNYWLLLLSICIFILTVALYYPVLAMIPIFLFLVVFILSIEKRGYQYYVGALITLVVSLVTFYSPLIIYLLKKSQSNSPQIVQKFTDIFKQSSNEIVQNLIARIEIFLNFFFINPNSIVHSFTFIVAFSLWLAIVFYFFYLKMLSQRKCYLAIILCSILSFFIIIAFNPASSIITFPTRHFTPIFGLFIIFISEIINSVFSGKLILRISKVLIIAILLIEFTQPTTNLSVKTNLLFQNPLNFFNIPYIENPAVLAVKSEILSIQSNQHKRYLDFFSFISYRNGYEDRFVNEIFWRPLEKEFNQKLTKINDDIYRGYEPITNNENFFLRCQFQYDEKEECLNPFLKDHPNYLIVKKIFLQNPSVYLTRRNE